MANTYTMTVNTSTLMETGYNVYIIDATSNDIALTLPTIVCDGMNFLIRRIDSNANNIITLVSQSGELIDGTSSKLLNPNGNIQINSNGNQWHTNGSPTGTGNEINIAFSQSQGNQTQPYALVNNPNFSSIGMFTYNGSNYYGNRPIKLEILYSINSNNSSNTNFTIQLQDLTNAKIITTIGPVIVTGSSVTFLTASTTTFENVPTNLSLFELDGKISAGTIAIRIHSIKMILN